MPPRPIPVQQVTTAQQPQVLQAVQSAGIAPTNSQFIAGNLPAGPVTVPTTGTVHNTNTQTQYVNIPVWEAVTKMVPVPITGTQVTEKPLSPWTPVEPRPMYRIYHRIDSGEIPIPSPFQDQNKVKPPFASSEEVLVDFTGDGKTWNKGQFIGQTSDTACIVKDNRTAAVAIVPLVRVRKVGADGEPPFKFLESVFVDLKGDGKTWHKGLSVRQYPDKTCVVLLPSGGPENNVAIVPVEQVRKVGLDGKPLVQKAKPAKKSSSPMWEMFFPKAKKGPEVKDKKPNQTASNGKK